MSEYKKVREMMQIRCYSDRITLTESYSQEYETIYISGDELKLKLFDIVKDYIDRKVFYTIVEL